MRSAPAPARTRCRCWRRSARCSHRSASNTKPTGGGAGPDVGPIARLGAPWAQLAQDGTDYFDYHHTANDTLDKIDAKALDQQVAAYAVMAYLAAESEVDFGRSANEGQD